VAAVVAGLDRAHGDVLVIVDLDRGYTPEDVARVIEPLLREDADLVVGSRSAGESLRTPRGGLARGAGAVARRLIGSSDPMSGLVALSHRLARTLELVPVGSMYTLEILARTDARRLDVSVGRGTPGPRRWFGLDDFRHIKRLADHRLGNLSRLIQFCMVGASGMVVDLSCYALFQWVFSWTRLATMSAPVVGGSLALAVSGALAIALALTWNFSFNRRLTFNYARDDALVRQYVGYALSNALGIALSFSLRLILPRHIAFFHRHKLAAAVVGIVAATGISFTMARWVVFRGHGASPPRPANRPEPIGTDSCSLPAEGGVAEPHRISRSLSAASRESF
jgi:dolichol-phosphate mannosyltransferase